MVAAVEVACVSVVAAVEEFQIAAVAVASEKELPAADAEVAAFAWYVAHVGHLIHSSCPPVGAPWEEDAKALGVGARRSLDDEEVEVDARSLASFDQLQNCNLQHGDPHGDGDFAAPYSFVDCNSSADLLGDTVT